MLAGNEKSRADTRMTSMMQGTMRDSRGLRNVRIADLSPRGLLVICDQPPPRGEIVDITLNGHHIVSEARWSIGRRSGLRSSQRIDVQAIFSGRKAQARRKAIKIEPSNESAKWSIHQRLPAFALLILGACFAALLIANLIFVSL